MTICNYNARTLASEAAIGDLMMQAKKIKYDVIGLTDTRRRHPLTVYEAGEELFLGTCDSRGVGGVGILVNTSTAKNIDSFEQLTTRIGRLRMRRCGPTPALTIFVAYAPTSSYEEEEVEAFYMDLEKFYREDHAFYKVIIGDFNAKVGPRRTPEELHIGTHGLQWNNQGKRLSEFIMTTKTIHGNSQFQKPSSPLWMWESPGEGKVMKQTKSWSIKGSADGRRRCTKVLYGIGPSPPPRKIFLHKESRESRQVQREKSQNYHQLGSLRYASREAIKEDLKERRAEVLAEAAEAGKKIIYNFYSDLIDSHVHLPAHHLREDGHVIPVVLPSEIRHAIMSVRKRTVSGPDRIRPEQPKNLPPVFINTLARLFTRYLSECKVPKQWETNKTVLLYKKGDPHNIGNYRPICLLSVIYKLFTRVILNRIENVLDEGQLCEQAGFRNGLCTAGHIHTVSIVIETSEEYDMQLCRTSEGLKKALTLLRWKRSWRLWTTKVSLLNIQGVRVDGLQLHHLHFDDDIVLVTPSNTQAERMLTEFDKTCGCIGLQLNLRKTTFMPNEWVSDTPLTLNGTNISENTSYIYLGRELNMINPRAGQEETSGLMSV
ncbi:hypothetical protein RB195_009683 [Necator americanus]|uniref:Reverse transcriptase domain-containing protein n=1 Tax=Necator americanus TaxID=51031 RepID=A0ABR1CUY5_NECAM